MQDHENIFINQKAKTEIQEKNSVMQDYEKINIYQSIKAKQKFKKRFIQYKTNQGSTSVELLSLSLEPCYIFSRRKVHIIYVTNNLNFQKGGGCAKAVQCFKFERIFEIPTKIQHQDLYTYSRFNKPCHTVFFFFFFGRLCSAGNKTKPVVRIQYHCHLRPAAIG